MKTLANQALDRLGKQWGLASQTREGKLQGIKRFAEFVGTKYGLERIENLKPGHITTFAESLKAQGLSARTGANYMAHIRDLCVAIGKANIVARDNAAYGFACDSRQNPLAMNRELVAEIRGMIDAKATTGDRVAQMMSASAAMREGFGLRHKEALLTHLVVEVAGKAYIKVEGAKGGRERLIEIRTPLQWAAMEKVAATAAALGNANGRIIPPEMTLKQAVSIESRLWHRLGGTRENKASMHLARHDYAQRRLAEGASRAQVNRELGHGDHRSLGSYSK